MLLLGIWHNNYNLRYVSTTHVQFTFSAGTVFVLSAIQAISGPRLGRVTLASSLSQIETCLEYLTIIGRSWETAECAKEILLNFFDETLKPRLLLRGGEANLKFEIPSAERARARARASSTASTNISQNGRDRSRSTYAPASAPSPISPISVPSLSELQFFPGSSPPVSNLGWPVLHTAKHAHHPDYFPSSNLSSPTVDNGVLSFSHSHTHGPQNDMDLDVGYSMNSMGMNIVPNLSATGHVASSGGGAAHGTSVDMMSFGVPELGVGYQFDPHTQPHVALEFSEEELAIMDQICRQQGGTMMYPSGPQSLQVG